MDSRAKQRLTGAVILVALFVLLVPELLTGPKDSVAPTTPDDEGLRRYIIDLNTPGSSVSQDPVNEPAVALPPLAEAPMAGAEQRAQPGEAAAPEQPQAEPEAPAARPPAPAMAHVPAPESRNETRPVPAASTAPPRTASPTPAPTPAASGAQPRSFVVQLGSFSSKENAQRLVRDMTGKGFTTFIAPITTNGRELYRVRVGPTRDRPAAEALAAQLKRVGQSGSIVPIP
jgi:DedD protein